MFKYKQKHLSGRMGILPMASQGLIATTTAYPSVYPSSYFQPVGAYGNSYPMVSSTNHSNPVQYNGNKQQQQQPYPAMSQSVFSTYGTIAPSLPLYSNMKQS